MAKNSSLINQTGIELQSLDKNNTEKHLEKYNNRMSLTAYVI